MNFTEQKNYIIAGVVSLTFHFLLLAIYLPGMLDSKNPGLETLPVGLVEIASGSPGEVMVSLSKNRPDISAALNSQGSRQPHKEKIEIKSAVNSNQSPADATTISQKEAVAASGNQSSSSGDIEIKSAANPNQPPKDTVALPKKEATAVSDNPSERPGIQSTLSGNTEAINDSGNSGIRGPQSLGTGEEMVAILGPMPPYPSNALKERKEGNVAMRILVKADGSLDIVIITDSSGDLRLDYAATSSIKRKWKFQPITKDYYIDLVFSFSVQIGVSVKFLNSKTRPQPQRSK
jgi:TonB family protein